MLNIAIKLHHYDNNIMMYLQEGWVGQWCMGRKADGELQHTIDEARVVAECGFCPHPRNNQYHYSHYRHNPAGSGTMITC